MITLAFSTLKNNKAQLLDYLSSLDIPHDLKIRVVSQGEAENCKLMVGDIDLVLSSELGLSKSRNINIEKCQTKYIWFLDDDVVFNASLSEVFQALCQSLLGQESPDFLFCNVVGLETGAPYKNYKYRVSGKRVGRLDCLKVSSIEIIGSVDFVRTKGIWFNENIGLGTKYPGNEEVNFLIDCFDQGAKMEWLDKQILKHTIDPNNRQVEGTAVYKVRGATASRYGIFGLFLITRWALRKIDQPRTAALFFREMLVHYFYGYKRFK
jgi:hypothetical protein